MDKYFVKVRDKRTNDRRELTFKAFNFQHAAIRAKPYLSTDEEIIGVCKEWSDDNDPED